MSKNKSHRVRERMNRYVSVHSVERRLERYTTSHQRLAQGAKVRARLAQYVTRK